LSHSPVVWSFGEHGTIGVVVMANPEQPNAPKPDTASTRGQTSDRKSKIPHDEDPGGGPAHSSAKNAEIAVEAGRKDQQESNKKS
jgi:hypothetical protein